MAYFQMVPLEMEEAARPDGCTLRVRRTVFGQYHRDDGRRILVALPPIILAFIFQRSMVSGMTAGAVKG
jgi:ABC-type glycerol-3-phosphate transport system permease component